MSIDIANQQSVQSFCQAMEKYGRKSESKLKVEPNTIQNVLHFLKIISERSGCDKYYTEADFRILKFALLKFSYCKVANFSKFS